MAFPAMPHDSAAYCLEQVRRFDRERYLCLLFAPEPARSRLLALYAFNLEVAKIRETVSEALLGQIRLQWWRDVLACGGHGDVAAHPVGAALREVVVRYRLPLPMLVALIDAHTFDLYEEPMASVADLQLYAAQTSAAVIEFAARVLNDGKIAGIDQLAQHAGLAMTIAGILRALPMHAARRQLCVPGDILRLHGVAPEDVFARKATEPIRAALADMRERAAHQLAEARALLAAVPETVAPALLPTALVPFVPIACSLTSLQHPG